MTVNPWRELSVTSLTKLFFSCFFFFSQYADIMGPEVIQMKEGGSVCSDMTRYKIWLLFGKYTWQTKTSTANTADTSIHPEQLCNLKKICFHNFNIVLVFCVCLHILHLVKGNLDIERPQSLFPKTAAYLI